MKAEMLQSHQEGDKALEAYGKVLELAEKGGDEWLTCQRTMGNLLVELGRPQEGLAVFELVLGEADLELPLRVNFMSYKAAAQLACGQREAALETVEAAKKLAATVEANEAADYWISDANERLDSVLKEAGENK
jgi:hypothetical protein